ncbi:copper-binding protein [Rhodoplanes sp. Z2-YC6860]|uniref:copper-binding protein n=1 Tax=Rhodoplanes sp. Z2-YC6860 TaxID=674703 RepID=UPI00078B4055|nr:copper-binding protein [Rhodoplanes sp. Z2-YC6860]AMN42046.1 periplasmic copper binding protein [Rhodoplanes sp. Z2-YC6860]
MKYVARIAAVLALVAAGPLTATAQSQDMIAGQVTKVDESAQKVTIKHGPIKKLGMDEGMTMVFRAPDAAMLKGLKAGDKIRFEPEQVNGQFTVTKIEKAK